MLESLGTVAIGFVLGFLIGLTGVGGGALVAPTLYVVLGMTYTGAVAMSLVYSVFTKVIGFLQHLRLGNVDWRLTLVYGIAGIPGGILGSRALYALPGSERMFALAMAGILTAVASLILAEAAVAVLANAEKPLDPAHLRAGGLVFLAVISFVVGLLLGITSVGSGSIIILSMVLLFRMPARRIVGSNLAIALLMVIPAGVTHVLFGGVDAWRLTLLMIGSVGGTALGSLGTTWLPDRQLKVLIAVVILVSAAATALKAW